MIPVLLASPSPELQDRVREATGGAFLAVDGPLSSDPADLLAQVAPEGTPEVVLLDAASTGAEQALHLAAGFDLWHPGISVVLVGDLDAEQGIAAMRAGVRDVVSPHGSTTDLRLALDRAGGLARDRITALTAAGGPGGQMLRRGRLIGVLSPKGGVGKTTVATNLAVGLARTAPGSTVLVDLDVQFGDVASGLDLEPEHCLPEAVRGRAVEDSMVLKTYLTEHQSGLFVLCAPRLPTDADGVTGDQVSRLLELLTAEFRYVVVDTAPGLSEHTLSVLDLATDLVLLTSMDLPGLRGLRTELEMLDQLGMSSASRQVVLNFADRHIGMSVQDAEDVIGRRVDLVLPRHKDVPVSINQGVPLLHGKRRNPVVKGLHRLVDRYIPPKITTTKAGRVGGRHRGEKVSVR